MRKDVSDLIFACYNRGCAPPPVGKGGSSTGGPATNSARIRAVQSRGRAVQAVKSGSKGAQKQLRAAREKVIATAPKTANGERRYFQKPSSPMPKARDRRNGTHLERVKG